MPLISYVQESGRAGRDNQSSKAILFYSAKEFCVRKAKISKGANQNEFKKLDAMKAYCENTEVSRQFCLLKHFDGHGIANKTTKHKCCDICLPLCKCDKYVESLQQQQLLGNDLSAGFSAEVIEQILVVCNEVNSVEDIHVRVDMWDFEFIVIWLVLHHSLFPPLKL